MKTETGGIVPQSHYNNLSVSEMMSELTKEAIKVNFQSKESQLQKLISAELVKFIKQDRIKINSIQNQNGFMSVYFDFLEERRLKEEISNLKNLIQAKILEIEKLKNTIAQIDDVSIKNGNEIIYLKEELKIEQACVDAYANQICLCDKCKGSGTYVGSYNTLYKKRVRTCEYCDGSSIYVTKLDNGELAKVVQAKRKIKL